MKGVKALQFWRPAAAGQFWRPAAAGQFWPRAAAGPALAVTLAALTALLTACSATSGSHAVITVPPSAPATAPASPTTAARSGSAQVFGRIFDNPDVTVTGGRLYVSWQVSAAAAAVPQFELSRIDQTTGAIAATHLLIPGQVGAPLAAGGWLWVPVATSAGESLLRLSPVSLAEAGNLPLGGGSALSVGQGHLADAGGALWVADGGRLLRLSLTTGQLVATIPLPGAATSDVAANKTGTVLVVSEATAGGLGQVQRRNPVSGTETASYQMIGVAAPEVGGIIKSGVWIAEATGMMGYVERFSAETMAPDPATRVEGTNGIRVTVAGGLAWVTQGGNARYDYCADPVTGRILARIPLPDPLQGGVLAVSSRYVYYQSPASNGFYLKRLTAPAACQ
jgi:hypothetical protein